MLDKKSIVLEIFWRICVLTQDGHYAPIEDDPIEETDMFQDTLKELLSNIGDQREVIRMNANTGKKDNEEIVGKFSKNTLNDNGKRLIRTCET